MTTISFTKLHGIGNDYVYIDARTEPIADPAALARRMSDRHFGVGADGLILVLDPDAEVAADLRMRMFNADGSEGEMCGNGIRGLCKLAVDRGIATANPLRVQTAAGVLLLRHEADANGRVVRVTVDMGVPRLRVADVPLADDGHLPAAGVIDHPLEDLVPGAMSWGGDAGLDGRATCVSMGNPHLVLFCEDPASVPLETAGPAFERHPRFPARINTHFVRVDGPDEITMRTWERGSGATLACGTGASAVCVAAALTGRTGRRVRAHLPGGDLDLVWDEHDDHVHMTGPATEVFTGTYHVPAAPAAAV